MKKVTVIFTSPNIKKLIIMGAFIFLFLNFIKVMPVAQTTLNKELQLAEKEKAIRKVALDYVEGWYSADTTRMANALSKDLKKRGFIMNNKAKKEIIANATYPQMIKWTGQRDDQLKLNKDIELKVEILEIGERIANVKTTTPDFIDYIHLGKIDGEWKIYNAIWEWKSSRK